MVIVHNATGRTFESGLHCEELFAAMHLPPKGVAQQQNQGTASCAGQVGQPER